MESRHLSGKREHLLLLSRRLLGLMRRGALLPAGNRVVPRECLVQAPSCPAARCRSRPARAEQQQQHGHRRARGREGRHWASIIVVTAKSCYEAVGSGKVSSAVTIPGDEAEPRPVKGSLTFA